MTIRSVWEAVEADIADALCDAVQAKPGLHTRRCQRKGKEDDAEVWTRSLLSRTSLMLTRSMPPIGLSLVGLQADLLGSMGLGVIGLHLPVSAAGHQPLSLEYRYKF